MNGNVMEYLKFKKMITPVFIQVLFWLFAALCVIAGLLAFLAGALHNSLAGAVYGICVIILGPVLVRDGAEMVIIYFKIYDAVQTIAEKKTASTPSA